MDNLSSFVSASVPASVFVFGCLLRADQIKHRRRWISGAAGPSVAYVFVHILPEMSEQQAASGETTGEGAFLAEVHVYVAALIGFVLFFGLDTMAFTSRTREHESERTHKSGSLAYGLHTGAMAVNTALISYLLVDWNKTPRSLVFYTVAMAFHLLLSDHSMREEYGRVYDRQGRWVLAASAVGGWALGLAVDLPAKAVGILVGFVAGSVSINGIRDELPRSGVGRFAPFALGAGVYALLLLL